MILFDCMEALRDYTFHALIFVANQLTIEEAKLDRMNPNLSWSYMYKTPESPDPNAGIKHSHACCVGVKDDEKANLQGKDYYTIIEDLDQPYVRFICENIVTRKGPTTIDFKCIYDETKMWYTYQISFAVAPDEDETEYHHAVAHIFDRCLGMLKTIEADSYMKHLEKKFQEEAEENGEN